jgi:two-component system C4-dicarboxylate transport response regulator DctD
MDEPHPITIIYVEDDDDVSAGCVQAMELAGLTVRPFSSVEQAKPFVSHGMAGVVVCDVRLEGQSGTDWLRELQSMDADLPVILVTGHGDIAMAVQAMRDGAYDFIEKPISSELLVATVRRAIEKRRLSLEIQHLRQRLVNRDSIETVLIGRSAQMRKIREMVLNLASTSVDVVIYGETGTGKEIVAQCLHAYSGRSGNFVPVNCGGLPETLVESEIFGHEIGAFTGATKQRIGKIEHADGGTLFLDEIESMAMAVQVKLLRALQERSIERVGSNKKIDVNCRVIAASKDDLLELSNAKKFRSDLYYRLGVAFVVLPPLRERREDIPLLFEHFVLSAAQRFDRPAPVVAEPMVAKLMADSWPGNVRELRNVADRFVLGLLDNDMSAIGPHAEDVLSLPQQMDTIERLLITDLLRKTGGDVSETAKKLMVPKQTLYDKIKRLSIVYK